jgi:hypothetical protein
MCSATEICSKELAYLHINVIVSVYVTCHIQFSYLIFPFPGKKSDDPASESFHPSIFPWNNTRLHRSTSTALAAGKSSPRKRLSSVTRSVRLPQRNSVSEASKLGRPALPSVLTPHVNQHDYISSKQNNAYIDHRLALCESILPGVTNAFMTLPKLEAKIDLLR